jgi:hypothetical protein
MSTTAEQWMFWAWLASCFLVAGSGVVWLAWLLAFLGSDGKQRLGRRLLIATGALIVAAVLFVALFPELHY